MTSKTVVHNVYLCISGEVGALSMLPLFLVDNDVHRQDVTFWSGVFGQAVSIGGSLIGGWILAHFK